MGSGSFGYCYYLIWHSSRSRLIWHRRILASAYNFFITVKQVISVVSKMNDTYWNDPANLALINYDRLCTQCMRAIDQANVISYANGSKIISPYWKNMKRGKFSSKKSNNLSFFSEKCKSWQFFPKKCKFGHFTTP